ncbi:MAG: hypothetical protein OET16_09110, partial [Chromatiales bacterium]|nr:hypothetical protein [Chromatiales bacterium]
LADNEQDVARLDDGQPLLRALAAGLGFDALVASEYGRPSASLRDAAAPPARPPLPAGVAVGSA